MKGAALAHPSTYAGRVRQSFDELHAHDTHLDSVQSLGLDPVVCLVMYSVGVLESESAARQIL